MIEAMFSKEMLFVLKVPSETIYVCCCCCYYMAFQPSGFLFYFQPSARIYERLKSINLIFLQNTCRRSKIYFVTSTP